MPEKGLSVTLELLPRRRQTLDAFVKFGKQLLNLRDDAALFRKRGKPYFELTESPQVDTLLCGASRVCFQMTRNSGGLNLVHQELGIDDDRGQDGNTSLKR